MSEAVNDRPQLAELESDRPIHGWHDAARTSDEYKNYWAYTESHDADTAYSRQRREILTRRSRYETENNGYTDGMLQTHCNYLIGTGPQLRMESRSTGFNEMVEFEWRRWSKMIQLRRKLWTQCHAKIQDGEGFGIAKTNLRQRNRVKLDYMLIEAEQCQTLNEMFGVDGYIDGIRYDEFGNPLWYDILPHHPGGQFAGLDISIYPEAIPARFVMHWYKMRRPGQHRGYPEFASTMLVGASSRRFREATVAAAETAADFTVLLKTQMSPDVAADAVAPFSTLDIQKRMMASLPMGWDAAQMRAEHPNALYKDFHRCQINEQGRPKSIPVNVGMADSSEHNFASGKLDHLSWFAEIKVEREDAADLVLDPLFELWFDEARRVYGWVWDQPYVPIHSWDWPSLPVADEKARAQANKDNLANGSTSLSAVYRDNGKDFEDVLPVMASDYGVTPDEMRAILLQANLGTAPAAPEIEDESDEEAEDVDESTETAAEATA